MRDHIKVPKDQKTEDFDFHEFTADLANSISDSLYRKYLPEIDQAHLEKQRQHADQNITNDMVVDEFVEEIDKKVKEAVAIIVSSEITDAVSEQLLEQYKPNPKTMEAYFDSLIVGLRWAIAPFFICIVVVLICIGMLIFGETIMVVAKTIKFLPQTFNFSEPMKINDTYLNQIQAGILSILDLILISSLVVMVTVGGYENTISRIGMSHQLPSWFGKLDIGQLKIKVAASIVIISSIHLLMSFMNLRVDMGSEWNPEPLKWTAITHVVFVLSALTLAYMDAIGRKGKSKGGLAAEIRKNSDSLRKMTQTSDKAE